QPGPGRTGGSNSVTGKAEKMSAATRLVQLVEGAGVELFHNVEHAAYARVPCGTHHEVWAVRSTGFRRWLSHRYYSEGGRTAGGQAVQDAIGAIEGKATFEGPEMTVNVRLAEHAGRVYLDLGNPSWEVVEIDAQGWRVRQDVPVRFRRPKGLLP